MTLEMLADNRIEFVRKFITEDRGQFAKTVQEYVDGKEKKPFSLEEAVDLAKEFRSSITREEVWQVVSEDQVSNSSSIFCLDSGRWAKKPIDINATNILEFTLGEAKTKNSYQDHSFRSLLMLVSISLIVS